MERSRGGDRRATDRLLRREFEASARQGGTWVFLRGGAPRWSESLRALGAARRSEAGVRLARGTRLLRRYRSVAAVRPARGIRLSRRYRSVAAVRPAWRLRLRLAIAR